MHLTPKKILEDFRKKNIDKSSAVNSLIHLIENVDNAETRLKCIQAFQEIGSTQTRIFSTLENLLISDSNEEIRFLVAFTLKFLFKEKALSPLKWALDHEKSWQFLIKIVSFVSEIDTDGAKSVLINEIKNFKNPEFNKNLRPLFKSKEIQYFENDDLAKIINNYNVIQHLVNALKEVKYKVKRGVVVDLDLSFIIEKTSAWKVLKHLSHSLSILSHLEKLNLKSNQIGRFPSSICSLSLLKYLNLGHNNLSKLPDEIGSLKSLGHLNLRHNNLKEIPESIGSLTGLKTLYLQHNELSTLPPSISNLTSLEVLNLHGNQFTMVPSSIKCLSSLKNLKFGLNDLKNVPKWMKNLRSLKKLGLGGNKSLFNLEEWIDFLPPLVELNLYANDIKTLPESIGTLNSLEVLIMPNNQLTVLPESFRNLISLKRLDLSWNDIIHLPEWIGSFASLEELNLRGNKLTTLPRSITQLSSLKILDVTLNKNIVQVPSDLENKGIQIYK